MGGWQFRGFLSLKEVSSQELAAEALSIREKTDSWREAGWWRSRILIEILAESSEIWSSKR